MNIDEIKTVGVAGAGSMGAGIIQVAAQAGFQVKVVDVSEAVWARAEKTITKSLERMLVKKETITEDQMNETLGRISFSTDVARLADVPFIFEAVFERHGGEEGVSTRNWTPSAATTRSTPPTPPPSPSPKWPPW